MGETRVDLQHLLEDIRDAYPGSLEETIVTEIVANSLDSGATEVRFEIDASQATLTVADDGAGMARRELARYHDIAASSKIRGEGIGFAGVGIKLGILASEEVFTETRRGKSHVATSWRLASRHRAPWRWVRPLGLVGEHGTAVQLKLRNPLSLLVENGFLEQALLRHFQPLLDPAFDEILESHYSEGVRFIVAALPLERTAAPAERAMLSIRLGRKRKPSALGYLLRQPDPLPEDRQGVAVSTLGKVIKRGWDWLGFSPADSQRVGGLIEVPGLAGCLTLNKADFIRAGPRGALYLAYRKAIQETVSAQLAAWGDMRDTLDEEARRRRARPIERDLTTVLVEMAEEFPLIASLVEQRAGGQKRLPMGRAGEIEASAAATARPQAPAAMEVAAGPAHEPTRGGPMPTMERSEPLAKSAPPNTESESARVESSQGSTAEEPPAALSATGGSVTWPRARGRRRPARLGLTIQFERRPGDPNLGRLLESTVWVNEAHPAYRRAAASRAEGYHLALTVAMALAPLAVEPAETHAFVTAFLARWGEALDRPTRRRRHGPRR